MNKVKIAILGGGVTGVTLAKAMSESDLFEVDLIEKASSLGGFHRNFEVNNLKYDIGAFAFFRNHNLFQSFPDIQKLYQPIVSNFGSVVGKNRLDAYPCTLKGYLEYNGFSSFLRTCFEIPISKLLYWKRDTVTSFIKYYIGQSAYHKTGLKNYIERLYQVSDQNIDIQFANKRLSCIANFGSLRNIAQRKLQGKKQALGPASLKSVYVRPKEGFSKVYNAIHQNLLASGVAVKLNAQLKSIRKINTGHKPQFVLELAEETKIYDKSGGAD